MTNSGFRGTGIIKMVLNYAPEQIVVRGEGYSRLRIRQQLFGKLMDASAALGFEFVNDKDEPIFTKHVVNI